MQVLLDSIRKQYDETKDADEKAALLKCVRTLENTLAQKCFMAQLDNGQLIECYGVVEENSNFEVVCEDEYEDTCWADGVGEFNTWTEVAKYLQTQFDSNIIEITAV